MKKNQISKINPSINSGLTSSSLSGLRAEGLSEVERVKYQKHILNVKNFKIFNFCYVFLLFAILFLLLKNQLVNAQYVSYPIPELGNCQSERECELYCEIPKNTPACWSYERYVMNASENVLGETTGPEFTFPIAELGNCASASACFAYCEKPQNHQACYNFAKSKGLVKEKEEDPAVQKVIEAAKTELGCDSKEVCRNVCNQPENFDKCRNFAQKHSLARDSTAGQSQGNLSTEVIEAAKTELGCDSAGSCASFCAKQENRERCSSFGQRYNLGPQRNIMKNISPMPNTEGQRKGPGDCTSEEECRKYCEKHPKECPGFTNKPPLASPSGQQKDEKGQFLGPTGCRTEAECKAYCKKHPKECPGFPKVVPKMIPASSTRVTPVMLPTGKLPNPTQTQPTSVPASNVAPTVPPEQTP